MNGGHGVEQGDGGRSTSKRYPRALSLDELASLSRRPHLDTDQACHYLCFETLDGLYTWLRRHAIPRLKRGRILIFRRGDLDAALAGRSRQVETFIKETGHGAAPPKQPPTTRRQRRSS